MRARKTRWRRLPLGQQYPIKLPSGEDYVVTEERCPFCRTLLGWRESIGVVQLPAFPQSDGSTFYRLPHTLDACPECGRGPRVLT